MTTFEYKLSVMDSMGERLSLYRFLWWQEAERRAYDARSESVSARLQTTRVAQAKMKKDATERERYLSKIQAVWNERKKTAASLEDQVY